jgi:glutaredoxin
MNIDEIFYKEDVDCIIYSKLRCPMCDMTIRMMTQQGISYKKIMIEDLTTEEIDELFKLGNAVPAVFPREGEPWVSYRPDRIQSLAKSKVSVLA